MTSPILISKLCTAANVTYFHSDAMIKVVGMIELSQKRDIEVPQIKKRIIQALEAYEEALPSSTPLHAEAKSTMSEEEDWSQPQSLARDSGLSEYEMLRRRTYSKESHLYKLAKNLPTMMLNTVKWALNCLNKKVGILYKQADIMKGQSLPFKLICVS